MAKIVLNAIVKDCADYVEKMLASTKGHIDYYVIGFGGVSKDNTTEVVNNWLKQNVDATKYSTLSIVWTDDFAEARNKVLQHTKEKFPDSEWLFWIDSDDQLLAKVNLHEIAEKTNGGVVQFPYYYQFDENGKLIVWHARERLVNLSLGWHWVRPVHETLMSNTEHNIIYTEDVIIIHDSTKSTDRTDRNRKILYSYLEKNPGDRRTILYMGHSYYSSQEYVEAIEWFSKYFYQPENVIEQWSAAVFAGRCCVALEQWEEASGWFHHALDLRPEWVDSYIGLGIAHTRLGNYDAAVEFFKQADTKDKPPSILFIVESEYTWNRYCYEHEALAMVGRIEDALRVVNKALEINPEHKGFLYYFYGYREALASTKATESVKFLVLTLIRRGDGLKAMKLLDTCLPVNIQEEEEIRQLRDYTFSSIEHIYNPELYKYVYEKGNSFIEAGEEVPQDRFEGFCEESSRVQAVEKLLQPHLKKAEKEDRTLNIIDIGCGGGMIPIYLASKYNVNIVGVEYDHDSVEVASGRIKELGLEDKVNMLEEDIFKLDISQLNRFDVCLIQEVIEHTDKPEFIVGTATDIADNVIITTPHMLAVTFIENIRNPRNNVPLNPHVKEFSRADMENLGLMSGYSIYNLYDVYDEVAVAPGYGSWVMELRNEHANNKEPIVMFCGKSGGEVWDANQIDEKGLGGSETAAIKMTEAFQKKGHVTILYGPKDGVYNGVIHRKHEKFDPAAPALGTKAKMFISSRIPDIIDRDINADYKALWCHDNTDSYRIPIFTGELIDRITPERVDKYDGIFVLSEWSKKDMKQVFPFIPDEKYVVTSNGIESINFDLSDTAPERKRHSFIYASSADRGLERILELWPKIHKKWKDATLDIYYGLDVMQKVHGHIPQVQEFMGLITKLSDQPGITWKGRIGQKALAEEYKKHQFWFYPTDFKETFCITALEAQAAGCIPLTTNVGAVKERVPEEFRLDWKNGSEFLTKLVELDNMYGLEPPKKLRKEALSYTWDKVAEQWVSLVD